VRRCLVLFSVLPLANMLPGSGFYAYANPAAYFSGRSFPNPFSGFDLICILCCQNSCFCLFVIRNGALE